MNVSPQNPRSISAALGLLFGWLYILGGSFILVVGGKDGLRTALTALCIGVTVVSRIYYRERNWSDC